MQYRITLSKGESSRNSRSLTGSDETPGAGAIRAFMSRFSRSSNSHFFTRSLNSVEFLLKRSPSDCFLAKKFENVDYFRAAGRPVRAAVTLSVGATSGRAGPTRSNPRAGRLLLSTIPHKLQQ